MGKEGIEALKKLLISGVESLVERQAERLKIAVENKNRLGYTTAERDGDAELLVAAGLLRHDGKSEGLHSVEFHYDATKKGIEIYKLIYGK